VPAPILPALIVTADDLGSSRAANLAIVQGLRDGHITHASMIVNMDAFGDACDRVLALGLTDRIGLHLNFTDGPPLTVEMERCRRFCVDGHFRFPMQGRGAWPLSAAERRAVAAETRVQLARLREAGCAVTYLDSHHHVHMQPNLAGTILAIAEEAGITRVRPPRFPDPTQGRLHRLKDVIFRRQLAAHQFPDVSHLGDLDEALLYFQRGGTADPPMAILTHPSLDAAGTVVDGGERAPLSDRLRRLRPHLPDLIDDAGRVHEALRAAG
jgi:predicted glycoside hydrolase/deacetylase ChbG (UPF0249 family)